MTNYNYLKAIVDEVNKIPFTNLSFREEVIDHYASLYEELIQTNAPDIALEQVIKHIKEDNIHQLKKKSKNNHSLIMALAIAFISLITVFIIGNQDKINSSSVTQYAAIETNVHFIDPPYGNPLKNIEITSGYGQRKHPIKKVMKLHKGIDLRAPLGTPVYSVEKGTVIDCGFHDKNGFFIEIKHDEEHSTRFHHLQKVNVIKGQTIQKDQQIGTVGNSGMSTRPHLHYEIIKSGETIDPEQYLKV